MVFRRILPCNVTKRGTMQGFIQRGGSPGIPFTVKYNLHVAIIIIMYQSSYIHFDLAHGTVQKFSQEIS